MVDLDKARMLAFTLCGCKRPTCLEESCIAWRRRGAIFCCSTSTPKFWRLYRQCPWMYKSSAVHIDPARESQKAPLTVGGWHRGGGGLSLDGGFYGMPCVLSVAFQRCAQDPFKLNLARNVRTTDRAPHRELRSWPPPPPPSPIPTKIYRQLVVDTSREVLSEWGAGVFDDPRLEVHYADAHAYLRENEGMFDVIIMDIADPIEAGPGYVLYTQVNIN